MCHICKREVKSGRRLNVNDKLMCIQCAYSYFPKGSPALDQIKKIYWEDIFSEATPST